MIDTHCHLIDSQFRKDLNQVLERARNSGVKKIINVGYDVESSKSAITMNEDMDWIFPAIGVHPNDVIHESEHGIAELSELIKSRKVFAIGETGLDYHHNRTPRKMQEEFFRAQIKIARKHELPLLIHTRNAFDDAVKVLRDEHYCTGVFHCFTGTYEQARVILDTGFYLGFGGILTFSKSTQDVFKKLPATSILLETDAPYLAPANHRGKRNEPSYIIETLRIAAALLNVSSERLEEILDSNAIKLFSL